MLFLLFFFRLILLDIRFVSSTYDADLFTNQFSAAMIDVMNNKRTILTSRSRDVVSKVFRNYVAYVKLNANSSLQVPEISLLSPTILYLFTSTPPPPFDGYNSPLTRNLQVL